MGWGIEPYPAESRHAASHIEAVPTFSRTFSEGADTGTAIAIAVPFGVLGVFLNTLRRIINARFAHMADKYALEGNTKGIRNCAIWWPLAMNIVTKFPFMFVAVYYGTTVIDKLVDVLPAWVMTGFSVAGGMMPTSTVPDSMASTMASDCRS